MRSADEVNSVAYRDVLMNTILGLVMMVAVVFLMVKLEQTEAKAQIEPPGNLTVYATWPAGEIDIDLWATGPAEPAPIGFSNKSGLVWDLLRDDLGDFGDALPLNFENMYTRGIIPGDYSVNLYCYRCPNVPVMVDVAISINDLKSDGKTTSKTILKSKVQLTRQAQEKTVANFRLLEDGSIDEKSLNNVFTPLMAAGTQRRAQ
jgi:hypothetical protein